MGITHRPASLIDIEQSQRRETSENNNTLLLFTINTAGSLTMIMAITMAVTSVVDYISLTLIVAETLTVAETVADCDFDIILRATSLVKGVTVTKVTLILTKILNVTLI